MPTLAAKISVAAAAAVVVWTGFEAIRVRHVVAEEVPPSVTEPVVPPAGEPPRLKSVPIKVAKSEEPQPESPAPWGIASMARIHGRVVGNHEEAAEPPKITAEDPTHSYDAEVEDDGQFEINLPVGHYTVVATLGDLVAAADVAGLSDGDDRDITLVLGEGAEIEGTVHAPNATKLRAEIELRPTNARDTGTNGVFVEKSGHFAGDGLIPGRSYDLVVTAQGMRKLHLHNVIAPSHGIDVTLETAPALRGGFGLAAGQECPMQTVQISGSGENGELEIGEFDDACQFVLLNLPDAPTVHITAEGGSWHFEADVALPEHGDPSYLCLRRPCHDTGL